MSAFAVEKLPRSVVAPGCYRIDLPGNSAARSWIVDIDPGCEWPDIDVHDEFGEIVYVVSGELIEDGEPYGEGTYLYYAPHSAHRPRSQRGVRLFGVNLSPR